MESRPRHNLDNQTFRGRLRGSRRASLLDRPHSAHFKGNMSDIDVAPRSAGKPKVETHPASMTTISLVHDVKPAKRINLDQRLVHIANPGSTASRATGTSVDKAPATTLQVPITKPRIDGLISTPKRTLKPRPDLPKQKRSNVLKRQMLKAPPYTIANKHKRPLVPALLSGLAVILFLAGILVLVNTLRTNHTVKAQVKQLAQKTESDNGISEGTPSEENPPSAAGNNNYQVSADLPRTITIDKINVSARIRRVGIGPNNILNAPANIFDIGWYDGSAKPGENGTMVLDGHVSGPTKHGTFYSIGTLKVGDKIKIDRGDGKQFSYSVTGTELFDNDKVDMSKVLTSSVAGKPGLNLMTCAGRFNVRTNQFEQRVVVYAVQD